MTAEILENPLLESSHAAQDTHPLATSAAKGEINASQEAKRENEQENTHKAEQEAKREALFHIPQSQRQRLFKKPPLVFLGNKKNALNNVKSLIMRFKAHNTTPESDLIFLDCFGGSGLLSNTFKYYLPQSRVIWNDFDDYRERLEAIPTTEAILGFFDTILRGYGKNAKISSEDKQKCLDFLKNYADKGAFIDYLSISSFCLFSGSYAHDFATLEKASWFCKRGEVKKDSRDYLNNVERVRMDFRELIKPYHDNPNAFLILDPPYLQTNHDGYKDNFYRLADFLDLVDLIRPPYILFSNTKSDIKEFLQWYDRRVFCRDFNRRKIFISNTANNGNLEGINDYMFYEF